MKLSIKYAPAIALIFLLGAPSYADEPTPLSFAIVPQQSATKLAKLWSPILRYIGEKSGYTLVFRTAKDIPTLRATPPKVMKTKVNRYYQISKFSLKSSQQ